jgi:hypothetical protein
MNVPFDDMKPSNCCSVLRDLRFLRDKLDELSYPHYRGRRDALT